MNLQERNKVIFECHKQGLSQTIIGQIFEKSQSTISKVINLVKSGENVAKEETRGSKPKLSNSQKEELKELLKESPSEYGYTVWDKWSIKGLIANQFGVDYHENHICKIMKCINFSSQKPQQRDYRQDAEKVAIYKEQTAPDLKKKPKQKIENLSFKMRLP